MRRVHLLIAGSVLGLVAAFLVVAPACGGGGESPSASPTPGASPPATGAAASPTPPAMSTVEGGETPQPASGNLFGNPGFEDADKGPWFSLKLPQFEVSQEQAHTGRASAFLKLRETEQASGGKALSLVQEPTPAAFPEFISGYYRVDNWQKGTPKQYLEMVVIAVGATNMAQPYPNHQIRYLLAGVSAEPLTVGNGFFVFVSKEEPVQGQWVYFERNIKEDFAQLWQAVPEGYSNLRIIFEVRYDDKQAGGGRPEADVYFDDLYLGSAAGNPNRP